MHAVRWCTYGLANRTMIILKQLVLRKLLGEKPYCECVCVWRLSKHKTNNKWAMIEWTRSVHIYIHSPESSHSNLQINMWTWAKLRFTWPRPHKFTHHSFEQALEYHQKRIWIKIRGIFLMHRLTDHWQADTSERLQRDFKISTSLMM